MTSTLTSTIIKQTPPVMLAINPGTRLVGYAVLQGEELLRYGVKTILKRKTPAEILTAVGKFITELITDYEVSILAVEKMVAAQEDSPLLAVAIEQIKTIAAQAQIKIYEYAPSVVRKRLGDKLKTTKPAKITKREVARLISDRYRHLQCFYNRTRLWELRYYGSLFDAIAVGLVCSTDLRGETQNV